MSLQRLEHELDFIKGQQSELEDLLRPLEASLTAAPPPDPERERFAAPSRRRAFTRGPSASASPAIQRRRACADNGALRRGQPAVVQDQPVAVQDQPRQDQPVATPWQVVLFSRLLECLTALSGPRQRPPS